MKILYIFRLLQIAYMCTVFVLWNHYYWTWDQHEYYIKNRYKMQLLSMQLKPSIINTVGAA
jgi:hypothetical protein